MLAFGLYLIGFIAGVVLHFYARPQADSFHDLMVERFRTEFDDIEGAFRIFTKILLNNLTICAIMTFGGIVFAVPAAFILLANGIPLGIVLARSDKPLYVFVGSILPHGLFEFPAIFLAGSFGILLGIDSFSLIWSWMKGEGEAPTRILMADLRKVLKGFVLVVVLLTVAAGVETMLFIVYGSS
jgi:stage II sporulation protein M